MVSGKPPVIKRGNGQYPAVPAQRLPLFQMVLPALCLPAPERLFPAPVSYNRFVELTRYALLPLLVYTQLFRLGKSGGISFIDSTPLKVCHNRRIYSHKGVQTLCGPWEKLYRVVLRVQIVSGYQ
jgi:hypothetical protein